MKWLYSINKEQEVTLRFGEFKIIEHINCISLSTFGELFDNNNLNYNNYNTEEVLNILLEILSTLK